ncbi:hypothetical protein JB92DRAFT_3122432 [Gautieria morchelliformis]|nr:hypothetical protein JB92DRAFT_3122432 [Gautieria morchelliformis]
MPSSATPIVPVNPSARRASASSSRGAAAAAPPPLPLELPLPLPLPEPALPPPRLLDTFVRSCACSCSTGASISMTARFTNGTSDRTTPTSAGSFQSDYAKVTAPLSTVAFALGKLYGGGSGSSTRVVRQIKTVHPHVRSSSVASPHHSAPSSRPGSYHEGSEAEANRNGSQQSDDTPRRAPYSATELVAHKKQTPFRQPSLSRSSWKKAWGVEPPGRKLRSTEAPFEVLFTDDPRTSVCDIFSGRPSINLGDEDDWVDEDDDVPFAGGLGHVSTSTSHPPVTAALESYHNPDPLVLSPPP